MAYSGCYWIVGEKPNTGYCTMYIGAIIIIQIFIIKVYILCFYTCFWLQSVEHIQTASSLLIPNILNLYWTSVIIKWPKWRQIGLSDMNDPVT